MASGFKWAGIHRDDPATNAPLLNRAPRRDDRAGTEPAARLALRDILDPADLDAYSFKPVGTDRVPFSSNQIVKFRQHLAGVPVFGSLVAVELDSDDQTVSVSSSIGNPTDVDPVATLSPAQALASVLARNPTATAGGAPKLFIYFDAKAERWRLVYVIENVESASDGLNANFVIDANSGELVATHARAMDGEFDVTVTGMDVLGNERQLHARGKTGEARLWLYDSERNIHTHDFAFNDVRLASPLLPGEYGARPDAASLWSAAVVSAHANARLVADFLIEVLQRNNIDGAGGKIVSSVNCLRDEDASLPGEWRNASWNGRQMLYGQRKVHGQLKSYACSVEMMAHELFHGVTSSTAGLIYDGMSGLLSESYSDVFGISVANWGQTDVGHWEWRIGHEMRDDGTAIRSLANPPLFGHPDHMSGFLTRGENLIHKNSGIHNKAAYNVFTARRPGGAYFFSPDEVTRLFYVTLSSRLSPSSDFVASRRNMILSARSMFAGQPDVEARVAAVAKAFDDVGIVDPPVA